MAIMEEMQEYKNILVGVDGSDAAKKAFQKALEVGRRNQAQVIVAHVIENRVFGTMDYTAMNDQVLAQEAKSADELLAEYTQYAKENNFETIKTEVTYGSAKTTLTKDLAEKYKIDLIMVGQSGLNAVEKLIMGSVSSYIIRNAPCDVLIVR